MKYKPAKPLLRLRCFNFLTMVVCFGAFTLILWNQNWLVTSVQTSHHLKAVKDHPHFSEERQSWSRLSLETKGNKTLRLVQVLYTILEVVSSLMIFFRQSVSFASILLSLVSVSFWSGWVFLKQNLAKFTVFFLLKVCSRLGLIEKEILS